MGNVNNYDFEKILSEANILLLNKPSLNFFGILSYGIKKKVISKEDYDKLELPPSLAFTDGKTITFPVSNSPRSELIFLICHELMHIISRHIERRGERNWMLWAISADHVINRTLNNLSSKFDYIKSPEGMVFLKDIHDKHPEISTEQLYDLLKKYIEKDDKYKVTEGGDGDYKYVIIDDGKSKQYSSSDASKPQGGNIEEIIKTSKELSQKAKSIWLSPVIDRGSLSGDIVDYLDNIFEVIIPWDEVLQSAIMYYSQSYEEPSWSQRNIYIRNTILPAYIDGVDTMTLIVGIDTSGSVGIEDLKKFMGVVIGSVKYFKSLIILIHDVDIHTELIFDRKPNIMDIIDKVQKIRGRGGTSHEHVFNRIEELHETELISTTVFLTDFYSDVESIYTNYEWIKEIPTVWVLNSNVKKVSLIDVDTKTIYI